MGTKKIVKKGSATLHKSAFPTISGPRRILSIMLIRKTAHLNCILIVMKTGWKTNREQAECQAEQQAERKACAAKANAEHEKAERQAELAKTAIAHREKAERQAERSEGFPEAAKAERAERGAQ